MILVFYSCRDREGFHFSVCSQNVHLCLVQIILTTELRQISSFWDLAMCDSEWDFDNWLMQLPGKLLSKYCCSIL